MTRFTETKKWSDAWFRRLSPSEKLVFLYIVDNCDNAGFWEQDMDAIAFHTGLAIGTIQGAIEGLGRGLVGAGGWIWVRTFLKHQKNETLNPDKNNAHKQIVGLIREQVERFNDVPDFRGWVGAYGGLISPPGKVKVEVKVEGGEGETNKARCTESEAIEFCEASGLPASDGVWFFNKCEGNGWTNDKKPIKDWKATVRSWKAGGYMPSQKAAGKVTTPTVYTPDELARRLGPTEEDLAVQSFFNT